MNVRFYNTNPHRVTIGIEIGEDYWDLQYRPVSGQVLLKSVAHNPNPEPDDKRDRPLKMNHGLDVNGRIEPIFREYTYDKLVEMIQRMSKLFGLSCPETGKLAIDYSGVIFGNKRPDEEHLRKNDPGCVGLRWSGEDIHLRKSSLSTYSNPFLKVQDIWMSADGDLSFPIRRALSLVAQNATLIHRVRHSEISERIIVGQYRTLILVLSPQGVKVVKRGEGD